MDHNQPETYFLSVRLGKDCLIAIDSWRLRIWGQCETGDDAVLIHSECKTLTDANT